MCVLDYDFAILSNGFLVHRPGIKSQKVAAPEQEQDIRNEQASFIEDVVVPEITARYGTRIGCSQFKSGKRKIVKRVKRYSK